jgi:hypothetical protein
VKVFDSKTGQASKCEQGKGKIKVIIHWPNGAGIRRGQEHKLFFKWDKHFNNYNPDITDDNVQLQD